MAAFEIMPQIATEICGAISGFYCSCADGMKHGSPVASDDI